MEKENWGIQPSSCFVGRSWTLRRLTFEFIGFLWGEEAIEGESLFAQEHHCSVSDKQMKPLNRQIIFIVAIKIKICPQKFLFPQQFAAKTTVCLYGFCQPVLQLFSWPDIFQFYESLAFVYQPESGVLEIRKANNRKVINFMQFRSNGKVRVEDRAEKLCTGFGVVSGKMSRVLGTKNLDRIQIKVILRNRNF